MNENLCVAIENTPSNDAQFMVGRLQSRYGEDL